MTLQTLQRQNIINALIEFRKNYTGSQADFCKAMGINASAYSQLKAGIRDNKPLEKIISDAVLVSIGRKLNVQVRGEVPWNIVRTETYEYVTAALEYCQAKSIGRIFCDIADGGKTTAAKQYMLTHQNVFYIDCGQCKEKSEFVRALGKVVGVNVQGSCKDIRRDTIFMLQAMERPLVILDEWGDLGYTAFLEIKAYWNALEDACGWYMMGADGLKDKIERGIRKHVVGFTEMYRRLGGECMNLTSKFDAVNLIAFKKRQVVSVAEHNLPNGVDLNDVIKNTLSLTRVKENIRKVSGNELFKSEAA